MNNFQKKNLNIARNGTTQKNLTGDQNKAPYLHRFKRLAN